MKTKYRQKDTYPHGFDLSSKEYKRMWYLCKKHNISYEEYCTNREKYDIKSRRVKHLDYELYSPEYHKTIWLKKKYGITLEDYNKMLESQNNVCMICGKNETHKHNISSKYVDLAVDHDHSTGKVRGLLCTYCNVGLGAFKDNKELLQKAIEYLNKSLK